MSQTVSATVDRPDGHLNIVLGEEGPGQRPAICELVVAAFAPSFAGSDFMGLEESLVKHPLSLNGGARFWCVSLAEDPTTVVALCKTIRRPLLVRDSTSTREEKGYCISTVATHAQYRRLGLASLLMRHVAKWLDGPADAAASMLYTSVGDFYVSAGWQMIPSIASSITHPSGAFPSGPWVGLHSTRLLKDEEIPALCVRDVADLKDSFGESVVRPGEVHLAVLPSADVVTYLQKWGDGICKNLLGGEVSDVHGAICEAADTWIYWNHSFENLSIMRVRTPSGDGQGSPEVLASLLLDALEEARKRNYSKVVVWEPSLDLVSAMDLISKKVGVEVETKERSRSITSVRWQGSDETKKTTLHMNEIYAYS